jgi:cob(I)alamin adenosyltransferase
LASDPEKSKMKIPDLHEEDITLLENEIDKMNDELPPLAGFRFAGRPSVGFVLPPGAAAFAVAPNDW